MLLRKFFVQIVSKVDTDGFEKADDAIDKLAKDAKDAKAPVDKLDNALDKAGKEAEQAGRQMKTAGSQVGKLGGLMDKAGAAVAKFGPMILAAGAAAGLAAIGKAVSFVGDETERLDRIAKGAQKSGFGTEAYQQLDHVATLSGASIDNLDKGITMLNVELANIGRGATTGPVVDGLKDLGLAASDLDGKGPTEQLAIISRAMESVQSETERSRIAFSLMGEDGKELVPLLNAGAEAIEEMAASTGRLFTREELAKAEAYQDALTNLKKGFADIAGGAAIELAPIFERIAEAGAAALPEVIDKLKQLYEVIEPALGRVYDLGVAIYDRLAPSFADLWNALMPVVEILGGSLSDSINGLGGPIMAVVGVIGTMVDMLVFWLEAGVSVHGWINNLLDTLENKWPGIFNGAKAVVMAIVHPIDTVRSAVGSLFDWLEKVVGKVGFLADKIREIKQALGLDRGGDALGDVLADARADAQGRVDDARASSNLFQAVAGVGSRALGAAAKYAKGVAQGAGSKGKGGGGGGPSRPDFFDFEGTIQAAAKAQAEKFAAEELQRLIGEGIGSDEAIGMAREAGKQRAKELEQKFRDAGRVIDEAGKGILDVLGLRDPGSMLADRPAPQTLLITIAPIIKMVESLVINVTGGNSPEQTASLNEAAGKAKDAITGKLPDVQEQIEAMFRLKARQLQAGYGGGQQ